MCYTKLNSFEFLLPRNCLTGSHGFQDSYYNSRAWKLVSKRARVALRNTEDVTSVEVSKDLECPFLQLLPGIALLQRRILENLCYGNPWRLYVDHTLKRLVLENYGEF